MIKLPVRHPGGGVIVDADGKHVVAIDDWRIRDTIIVALNASHAAATRAPSPTDDELVEEVCKQWRNYGAGLPATADAAKARLLAALRASQAERDRMRTNYEDAINLASAAERERDAARAEASELRSEHVMTRLEQRVIEAERERDALREALMGLVTAVDDRIGMASLHTWKEQLAALEAARAALAPRPPCSAEATQGKPVKEE